MVDEDASLRYLYNWNRAKPDKFVVDGRDYVIYGTDMYGVYGELMPDGVNEEDSFFERVLNCNHFDYDNGVIWNGCSYSYSNNYYDFMNLVNKDKVLDCRNDNAIAREDDMVRWNTQYIEHMERLRAKHGIKGYGNVIKRDDEQKV